MSKINAAITITTELIEFLTKINELFKDEHIAPELYAYMGKSLYESENRLRRLERLEDHAHILLNLSRIKTSTHDIEMVKKRRSKG